MINTTCGRDNPHYVNQTDILLPKRKTDTHKYHYGTALIVAGSVGYTGAPCMASEAALRSGAGMVLLGVPESIYSITAIKSTEAVVVPLETDSDGMVGWSAKDYILSAMRERGAILIGPGLGTNYQLESLIGLVLSKAVCPVVLDADGLNNIKNPELLKDASVPVIITPHEGEFKRLGGDLSRGRVDAAADFAEKYRCYVVLKGSGTVTATPDGRVFVNTTGSPALAKAGSGDVLAGMITALCAQGFDAESACVSGVFLHGLAGDLCAEELGEYGVTATDVIHSIPKAFKKVSNLSENHL